MSCCARANFLYGVPGRLEEHDGDLVEKDAGQQAEAGGQDGNDLHSGYKLAIGAEVGGNEGDPDDEENQHEEHKNSFCDNSESLNEKCGFTKRKFRRLISTSRLCVFKHIFFIIIMGSYFIFDFFMSYTFLARLVPLTIDLNLVISLVNENYVLLIFIM